MRIDKIGVSNYRNIELARLDLNSQRVFLLGKNGQGKTNLLESIGYVTSLRAFRSRENETLIGPVQSGAEIVYEFEHEKLGSTKANVRIKKKGKEVSLDGEAVKRASDFVGQFSTVTLSSEDLGIVRGSPGGRRRFLDTFLCGVDRSYYVALQRYQKSLQERNALLKQGANPDLLKSFESQMVDPALEIIGKRSDVLDELREIACDYYERLSGSAEGISIEYCPNIRPMDGAAYHEILDKGRKRDSYLQNTGKGPHRDDFNLSLEGKAAADFASDGQQRSIALSLAFATLAYWRQHFGVTPVLLVDDVLGELDPERRKRFWEALDDDIQLIATGTELPKLDNKVDWLVYEVVDGSFTRSELSGKKG